MATFLITEPRSVFLHVPKTAGSSIREGYFADRVEGPVQGEIPTEWMELFKFGFVRHPLDRLISAWKMFQRGMENSVWELPDDGNRGMSLSAFLDIVADESIPFDGDRTKLPIELRHHTLPLVHPYHCLAQADFIGRFERLNEDFNTILDRLGLPATELPQWNKTDRTRDYLQYFDADTLARATEIYSEDFDRFGYELPDISTLESSRRTIVPVSDADMKEGNGAYYEGLPKETVPCPLCTHTESSPVHDNDRYGMGLHTVACNQCGLVYVNPRPTADALASFYANDYRRFYESIDVPTEEYVNAGSFLARAEAACKIILEHFRDVEGSQLAALDIGSAEGSFLRTLRQDERFAPAHGLEPNGSFAKFAESFSGADVFNGTFESFLAKGLNDEAGYDLISLNHVLEHLVDPAAELRAIRSLLKEDGLFYVEVPNVCSERGCGLGQFHVAHLYMFYPETFRMLLEANGFEIVELVTRGLPDPCPSMCAVARKAPITETSCVLDPDVIAERVGSIRSSVTPGRSSGRPRSLSKKLRRFVGRLTGSGSAE